MRLPLRRRTPPRTRPRTSPHPPLRTPLSRPRSWPLCLAAAAPLSLLLIAAPPPAHAADATPACAAPDARAFPLTTRIHDGPDSYTAGGGHGIWYLDLTNTTARRCTGIHPVVVLVDRQHALKPSQPRLEFYDGTSPRPHPVHFDRTDEAELVGAFDDGFPGFTVDPGKTLTVKVRLALAPDTVANEITADAAVVQRHADDGDWIGQSNDYRFDVQAAAPGDLTDPEATTSAASPATPLPTPTSTPAEDLSFTDELARTGIGTAHLVLAVTSVLLVTVGALLARRRL
ncbi:hypothetical protein [Streptomyces sp. NPDC101776]|uniref:hypothetical protein n=1 Tax=Streptomyces sp. NPDC101776 TaxID=3366146 RepID=UPI00382539FE